MNNIGVKAYLYGRNDLLIDGKKFSGNAICVSGNRVLQHGTLLFDSSINNLHGALKSRPEKFIGKSVQSNRSRVTNISSHLSSPMNIDEFKVYLKEFICNKFSNITPYTYTPDDIAAIDTLCAHFHDTGRKPKDYDAIFSGDLGSVGKSIVVDLMKKEGYDLSQNYFDCGELIFDKSQDVHAGASGCGCSGLMLCAHILPEMKKKNLMNI